MTPFALLLRFPPACRAIALAMLLVGSTAVAQQPSAKPAAKGSAVGTTALATFAGGCFWCMEPPYDKLDGVISTISGYMGGHKRNPTYEEVSAGTTGHTEVVQVTYDPKRVTYARLVEIFWRNIDPTVKDEQFCDAGSQYRSGIFWHNEEQRRVAETSKLAIEKRFRGPIHTEISKAAEFWPAEDYHQDYYLKNPVRYAYYRAGCGRDARLRELWGSADDRSEAKK
jgi:peptide-methionine (S)-S-oxide reductase